MLFGCVDAPIGHIAAPPAKVMNSRRLIARFQSLELSIIEFILANVPMSVR